MPPSDRPTRCTSSRSCLQRSKRPHGSQWPGTIWRTSKPDSDTKGFAAPETSNDQQSSAAHSARWRAGDFPIPMRGTGRSARPAARRPIVLRGRESELRRGSRRGPRHAASRRRSPVSDRPSPPLVEHIRFAFLVAAAVAQLDQMKAATGVETDGRHVLLENPVRGRSNSHRR